MPMELTDAERLILFNQYEILKHLDPTQKGEYGIAQEVLTRGYPTSYAGAMEWALWEPTPKEVCEEVVDILNMYRALEGARHDGVPAPANGWDRFQGFDGNEEPQHHGFVVFLVERLGRFEESKRPSLNSHHPTLDTYNAMLAEWRRRSGRFELSEEDVRAIVEAGAPL